MFTILFERSRAWSVERGAGGRCSGVATMVQMVQVLPPYRQRRLVQFVQIRRDFVRVGGGGWDRVRLLGCPSAQLTHHVISIKAVSECHASRCIIFDLISGITVVSTPAVCLASHGTNHAGWPTHTAVEACMGPLQGQSSQLNNLWRNYNTDASCNEKF